jgi:ribosomal protein S18 acetylase RimI-like enzyme
MIIRRATRDDASALGELGAKTFSDAFADRNRPEDIESYLARTYGETHQREEIGDPSIVTLLADEGGRLAGFAQLRIAATEHGDGEVARFYVDREHHGRGLAQQLMQAVLEAARERGCSTVWLGVWEHNARAIRFYEKCGFRDVGSHPFLLGSDLQTDRLMALPMTFETSALSPKS